MAHALSRAVRRTQALRLAIGLGIPFLAIVPTIPLLDRSGIVWFGLPLPVLWLFGCIPLTSACLAACWLLFDRHAPDDAPDDAPDTTQRREDAR